MKQKNYFLVILLLVLSLGSLLGQGRGEIVGKVIDDSDKQPLIGVSVIKKGTNVGTTTNAKGEFSIKAQSGDVLQFSYIGMKTQELTLSTATKISISMISDSALDEVVVIGYGTVRKSDLTGSVGSIKSEELLKSNPASLNQGLQGRLAGVQVNQSDGAPGAGISIQIRGANSFTTSTEPLYVIDGIPYSGSSTPSTGASGMNGMLQTTNPLSALSPQDIQSIEILKDASATAIYGSRGANGVVLVTTKRGTAGRDRITFSTNVGISKVVKQMDMLNAYEYANYKNEQVIMQEKYEVGNDNVPLSKLPYPGIEKIDPTTGEVGYLPGPDDYLSGKYPSTNWQDEMFQTAVTQEYNLSVDGGSDKGSYAISGNILDQSGVIHGSGYKRYSLRSNVSRKVHNWIELGLNMSFSNSLSSLAKTSSTNNSIMRSILFFEPTREVNDPELDELTSWFAANPYIYVRNSKDEITSNNLFASSFVELTPIKDLKIRQNVGYSNNNSERATYYNRKTSEGKGETGGFGARADNWSRSLALETIATYDKRFNDKHYLNVMGSFAYEESNYGDKGLYGTNFPNDLLWDNNMNAAMIQKFSDSHRAMTKLVSLLARVNYTFNDKYLLTASFRRDGSSKFSSGNRFANFFSGAFAWKISEEQFIKDLNVFSTLKLRTSFGETGNQAIGPYATRDYLANANYPLDGVINSGYANVGWKGPSNPSLKWETTRQYNAGIDMGFLSNKIIFNIDVYHKKTRDLLQFITLPQSTGYTAMTVNYGNTTNSGVELTAQVYAINHKNFQWDFNTNVSFNRNKIGGLASDQYATNLWSSADQVFLQRNGLAIGTIYGYVEDGFYDNEAEVRYDPYYADKSKEIVRGMIGEIKYKDLDGKPGITSADRQIIGDTNPDYIFGMTHNFKYKNLSLSLFLQGCVGGDIFNANIQDMTMSNIINVPREFYNSRWTPENFENAKWPKAYAGYNRSMKISDRFVEDGSYLRLKNINLSYALKSPFKGVDNINLNFSVSNVFTITGYNWFDPDVNSFGGDASRRGVDMYAYPSSRTYTFGIQCVF